MSSILNQGLTGVRDALETAITHVGVSEDTTAFAATQTRLNPNDTTAALIKAAATEVVDFRSRDYTIEIDGDVEFTDKTIWTIGVLDGAAETDAWTRTVRTQGIGVQAGDLFTVGVRLRVSDADT